MILDSLQSECECQEISKYLARMNSKADAALIPPEKRADVG